MMDFKRISSSFMIKNTTLENYSFNLVHYFMDKQDYTIFNFQEKILENFNHDYYNIIYIYSKPLFNDVNIESLLDKLEVIKKKLRKNFLLFNQQILVLATNCDMNTSKIIIPDNVDIINATDKEQLFNHDIIKTIYPNLLDYRLDLDFDTLSVRLNALSISYAKKISAVFNKKQFYVSILLALVIIGVYFFYTLANHNPLSHIILTKENLRKGYYHTLLTNHLFEYSILQLIISLFFIFSFGIRLEKIYGSIRYLMIIFLTMIFSNSLLLAFLNLSEYPVGFTPMVFTYVGSFIYVAILFRRFLAYTIKRILIFNSILLFIILLFGDVISLVSLIGALFTGFVSSFIVGIPKVKNGNLIHRILALVFVFILISLSISIGLK